MKEIDWTNIGEKELEAFNRRLALVETLLDDAIDEAERLTVRDRYRDEHGVSERTIRNYLKRYREQGARGLVFYQRTTPPSVRIHDKSLRAKILELIEQRPSRTVPQLRRILMKAPDFTSAIEQVSDRTIYRFLHEHGLTQRVRMAKLAAGGRRAYHQFEAGASMQLVQGDARDGIWLPNGPGDERVRKTYLFAWVDDYSRRILHAQYFWDEKLPCMEETFKTMVLRWGIPQKLYLDNGRVYIALQFARILAELKVKKIHHGPYKAWCKGKVESVMKTFKREFQGEAQLAGFQTLEELNTALWAWIDVEYNRRNHSTTGQPPEKRFLQGLPEDHRRVQDLEWFEALFLHQETRTVSKYGVIKLRGNQYHTTVRHGTVIEVRYKPFDLRTVVRFENGKPVETLGLKKLVNEALPWIPEERHASERKVSAEAAGYFSALRRRQAELTASTEGPQYSKLKGESRS